MGKSQEVWNSWEVKRVFIGGKRYSKCYFHENTKKDTYARVVIHKTTLQTKLFLIRYFSTESHWSELFPDGNKLRIRTILLPFIVSLLVSVPPAKPTSCCWVCRTRYQPPLNHTHKSAIWNLLMQDPPTENISITNDYIDTHTHTHTQSLLQRVDQKHKKWNLLGVRSLPLLLYPKLIDQVA